MVFMDFFFGNCFLPAERYFLLEIFYRTSICDCRSMVQSIWGELGYLIKKRPSQVLRKLVASKNKSVSVRSAEARMAGGQV